MKSPQPHLRADRVLATLDQLQTRINARFPEAGLSRVCADVIETAKFCARDARDLARPRPLWRLGALTIVGLGIAAQVLAFRFLNIQFSTLTAPELLQGLEAAVNLLILFGGATWFLLTLEERMKRQRALDALGAREGIERVEVIGLDEAGVWTLFARALSPHVRTATIHLNGVDFSDDEDFLAHLPIPLIRRAGDLRTAVALIAPAPLTLTHLPEGPLAEWIRALYDALDASHALHISAVAN